MFMATMLEPNREIWRFISKICRVENQEKHIVLANLKKVSQPAKFCQKKRQWGSSEDELAKFGYMSHKRKANLKNNPASKYSGRPI
jgi:hypothetical protein